jgi:hypothetical protein
MKTVQRRVDLLEIIETLCSTGRFTGGRDRRQQQADQDSDDRDNDKQLNERKPARASRRLPHKYLSRV